jgi:hypothetical protein
MTSASPLNTMRWLALSASCELGLPLPTPMIAPPVMAKLMLLVAVGTTLPCASSTSTVTTETSRPSARIVLRSGNSAIWAAGPVVVIVLVSTAAPLL